MIDVSNMPDFIVGCTTKRLRPFVKGPGLKLLIADLAKIDFISTIGLLPHELEAAKVEVAISLEAILGGPSISMTAMPMMPVSNATIIKDIITGCTARHLQTLVNGPILGLLVADLSKAAYYGDILFIVTVAVVEELADELEAILQAYNSEPGKILPKQDMSDEEILEHIYVRHLQKISVQNQDTAVSQVRQQPPASDVVALSSSKIHDIESSTNSLTNEHISTKSACFIEGVHTVVGKDDVKHEGLDASRWAPANRVEYKNIGLGHESAGVIKGSDAILNQVKVDVNLKNLAASRWATQVAQTLGGSRKPHRGSHQVQRYII